MALHDHASGGTRVAPRVEHHELVAAIFHVDEIARHEIPRHDRVCNAVVSKFYPYMLATFEYIIHNGMPKVIDVNGIAYSMEYSTPVPGLNPDLIYKEFITRVVALDNETELPRQIRYREMIKGVYDKVRQFGPAFFDGGKVISLIDGEVKMTNSFL